MNKIKKKYWTLHFEKVAVIWILSILKEKVVFRNEQKLEVNYENLGAGS